MKNSRLAHLFAITANEVRRLGWRFGLVAFGGTILGVGLVVAVVLMCISLVISIGGQSQIFGNLPLLFAAINIALGVLFLSKLEMLQRFQSRAAVGILYIIAAILVAAFYFTYPAYANLSSPQAAHSIPLWVVAMLLVGSALSFVLASFLVIVSGLLHMYRSWSAPTTIEQKNDKKEIAMTDLHSALKTEIVGTAGWDSGQLVLVRLQQGRDQFSHSLHVRPNSFSLSGIQVTDMLAILGFQRSRCSFVNGGECYAKEVNRSFDVTSFATIIKPMYDALCQSDRHFQTCGFTLDRPEGWGFFQGQASKGRNAGYSISGDGHTGHKIQRMKESEDTAFNFVFTWLESDRYRGWTTHYEPLHRPVSDEVSSVFNFLHLEQFASCPEFAFEPCYWRFVPFVERERDMFSGNTEIAHRSFDAHKEHFSAGIERLLFADQQARAFGLRFLPDSGPNVVRSKIVSAPAASAGKTPSGTGYEYDVAVSFAGTERALAEKLATATREAGFNVFYDGFYPEQLWGKDLASFFDSVYRKASHFCVMFISSEYRDRMWTTHERRSAMARAIEEKGNEYILPIEVKKVDIDGLVPTIGHLSLSDHTIDRISEILIKKLKSSGK